MTLDDSKQRPGVGDKKQETGREANRKEVEYKETQLTSQSVGHILQ